MKLFDEIPVLEDDKIIIHRMTEADAPVLNEMQGSIAVTRFLPTFLFEYQFIDKEEAIRAMYADCFTQKQSLLLGVYLKSAPDRMTGVAEIYNYVPTWNKASIGLRLNERYWSRGIGGRAIALLQDYLFNRTDVKRITAHIMTENVWSQRAVQQAGFRLRKANVPEDWGFPEPVTVNKYVMEKLGNIKYVKVGSGPKTMVVLPGLAFKSTLGSADLVEASYAPVFRDYTIYLFDDRSNIGADYTIRERAGDVAAEMRTLGLYGADVYGVSMGGMVGQYLAIDHPDLVKKLSLTATASSLCPQARQIIEHWKALAESGSTEQVIHTMVQDIYSSDTLAKYGTVLENAIGFVSDEELRYFIALVSAILSFDATAELNKIHCPVMVAGSEGDRVLFPEASAALAEKLGCEPLMYGSQYGHAFYDEARDHKQKVLEFFEKEE